MFWSCRSNTHSEIDDEDHSASLCKVNRSLTNQIAKKHFCLGHD